MPDSGIPWYKLLVDAAVRTASVTRPPIVCVAVQADEVSEELFTFHQMVNKMQEIEEEVQDEHKVIVEVSGL